MKIVIPQNMFAEEEYLKKCGELSKWHNILMSKDNSHLGGNYKGWARLPEQCNNSLIAEIKNIATLIQKKCTLFVVVGIGGSFLGAKAIIDSLNGSRKGMPEVVFAGFNMNGTYISKLKKRMEKESVCLCVISKSGTTVEPLLSYSVLKDVLLSKYGYQEARRRIFVITDEFRGKLKAEVLENQFTSLVIPDDVGGRYSVLSPAGLLPISVAGHDIDKILAGARLLQFDDWSKDGELIGYAASRVLLQGNGKMIEIFEYFEGNLRYFGEWLKQLFGETEGKDGKGAFPACLFFSRDLHSIGQFLQEGRQIFWETIIRISNSQDDIKIPWHAGYPYAGKTMEEINKCAEQGVIKAHKKANIPINEICVDNLDEMTIGKLIYFFEMSSALSAYAQGLNPFNQPGVEAYKEEMQKLITDL